MDYILRILCVIALIRFSVSQIEDELAELDLTTQENVQDETTIISSSNTFTIAREKHLDSLLELDPAEEEKVKSTGFYSFVEDYLFKDKTYMKYPRRIDCIMETLKKNQAINEISTDDMSVNFVILARTNSTVTVTFQNADGLIDDINAKVDSANYSCLMPGLVSVTILGSICLTIISLVICTNKNNPIPSEA